MDGWKGACCGFRREDLVQHPERTMKHLPPTWFWLCAHVVRVMTMCLQGEPHNRLVHSFRPIRVRAGAKALLPLYSDSSACVSFCLSHLVSH